MIKKQILDWLETKFPGKSQIQMTEKCAKKEYPQGSFKFEITEIQIIFHRKGVADFPVKKIMEYKKDLDKITENSVILFRIVKSDVFSFEKTADLRDDQKHMILLSLEEETLLQETGFIMYINIFHKRRVKNG